MASSPRYIRRAPLTTFTLPPSHATCPMPHLTQAFQSLIIFYMAFTLNWAALLRQRQRRLRRHLSPLSFVRCHFVGLFVVRNSLLFFLLCIFKAVLNIKVLIAVSGRRHKGSAGRAVHSWRCAPADTRSGRLATGGRRPVERRKVLTLVGKYFNNLCKELTAWPQKGQRRVKC